MSLVASPEDIRAFMGHILVPEQVVELRALYVPTSNGPRTFSGFFDNFEAFVQAATHLTGLGAKGVYFTPNPLKPTLLETGKPNVAIPATRGSLARDVDVLNICWLLVDVDPERDSGTSATEEEKHAAAVLTRAIHTYLKGEGWPKPVFGDSGNGYHLMYRVAEPDCGRIKATLSTLSFLFDNAHAKVDQKVYNPSRIFKIYGTIARKGDDTPLRPHRQTALLALEGGQGTVSSEMLDALNSILPRKGEKVANTPTGMLDVYIQRHFPGAGEPEPWQGGGRRWVFDVCPWDSAHTDRSAYILQFPNGGIAAGCLHKTCKGAQQTPKGQSKGWKSLQKQGGISFGEVAQVQLNASTENAPNLTDLGNAKRLVQAFQHQLMYVPSARAWFVYSGTHWARDVDGAIHRYAKLAVGHIFAAASIEEDLEKKKRLYKHALKSESATSLASMVRLAATEGDIAVVSSRLDQDPWLLNVNNGTLDLRTGKLQMHDRTDFLTKISPVDWDPDAVCPTWDAFLAYTLKGDQEVIQFIHRFFGYCLTGIATEQVLLFMEGTGNNGKTTALLTLMHIMGDYAIQGAPGLLMAKRGEAHPTEVADLEGVRFVANSEVEKGKPFAEVLIKQLTGSDRIRARKMRQDFYEFEPTHKLIIAANHRPIIKGNDEGIWRRVLRLPWKQKIKAKDKDPFFIDKLKAEAPGILRKLVEGCLLWQQEGLKPPASVQMATAQYREEMDALSEFLEDCCVVAEDKLVAKKALYLAYVDWCEGYHQRPAGYNLFCRQLSERDFMAQPRWVTRGNTRQSVRVWIGIGLQLVTSVGSSQRGSMWN